MVKLPVFSNPNPSIEWLRSEQNRLKNQADKMIATTKVMEILSRHGQLSPIGGSYL